MFKSFSGLIGNGLLTRRLPSRSRKERGLRGTLDAAIKNPYVEASALADPPPSGPPDNVLWLSVQNDPVNILWVGFDDAYEGDILTFMMDGVEFAKLTLGPTDTPPYPGALPATSRLVEGTHYLTLRYAGGSGSATSDSVPITFDYTAPGLDFVLAPLIFDRKDDIEGSGITAAKFRFDVDGNKYIWAEVASYGGIAAGDKVHLYCNGKESTGVGVALVVNNHIEVHISEAFLIEIGDTPTASFTYKVEDRAGNLSSESLDKIVAVQIGQIASLVAPTVPAFDNDPVDPANPPLIDEADARGASNEGFIVVVPWNAELLPADTIMLSLDGEDAGPVPIGANGDDIEIFFPYAGSQAVWLAGSTGGTADTRVSATVTYTVYRGAVSAGTSPGHPVVLNLYQKAIDPDPETPVNEQLEAPVVVSASGKRDEIPTEDFGQDAVVEIDKSTVGTPPPSGDAFEEGDTLNIHYGSQPLFTFTVPALGDVSVPLQIPLAGAVITAQGSGAAVPVWYEVLHPLTDGGSNTNLSPTKEIVVSGTDTQPGGGHLDAGTFMDQDANGFIPELYHYTSTRFSIPTYINRDPDDQITLHFELYRGPNHATGETAYPNHDYDSVAVNAGVDTPIIIPVPSTAYNLYGNTEALSAYVHIHAFYTVTKKQGDMTPVTSDQGGVKVDARFSDGQNNP